FGALFKDNTPEEWHTEPTCTAAIFAHLARRNIIAMLTGTSIAFFVIAFVLMVALKSPTLGLLSLVLNGWPVLMTFGIWAVLVGQIGIISSVIAATSMGLIVDDTVHILSKYRRARAVEGLSSVDAIRYVFAHVGTALWSTSVILISGFLVLTLSAFELNEQLGILTAMTIGSALFMDLTLLPALLMVSSELKARLRSAWKGG
ncbi:MAG: MMPL family transporter, partial [Pseudomonadales bacterium]|nr:MMPL family transporter [Pseudomonadales bacterium]